MYQFSAQCLSAHWQTTARATANRRRARLGDVTMKDRTLKDFSVRTLNQNSALQGLRSNRAGDRENLGTLRNRASATNEVNEDEPDIYSFRLNRQATVQVALSNQEDGGFFDLFGTRKRVQATLRNGANKLRATERVRPDREDDFRIRLNPGTYSIRVTGRSEDDVEYELKLRASDRNDAFDDD